MVVYGMVDMRSEETRGPGSDTDRSTTGDFLLRARRQACMYHRKLMEGRSFPQKLVVALICKGLEDIQCQCTINLTTNFHCSICRLIVHQSMLHNIILAPPTRE